MPKGFLVKRDRCEIAVPAYRAQQSAFALFSAGGRCVPANYAAAAFGPFSFEARSSAFAASCWSEAEHAARLLATVANEADGRRLAFSLAPRAAGWLTPPAEASTCSDSAASVAAGGAAVGAALEQLAPPPLRPSQAAAAAANSAGARKPYNEGRRSVVGKGAGGGARKKRRSHVMRKIHFDNEPPVSGIIIRRPPPPSLADCQRPCSPPDQQLRLLSSACAQETAAERDEDKEETRGDCGRLVSGDIDSKYNVVEITEEAKARLASIENRIGSFVCRLCNHLFPDAFRFAQHRCPSIVYVEYKCPECGKAFNCPANLASHRRWHKPRGGPPPTQPPSSQQRQPQQQQQETPPESPASGAPASPLGGCGESGGGVRLEAVVARAASSYYIKDEQRQRVTTSASPSSPADPSPRDGQLLRCRQCGDLFKKISALGRHVLDMHSEDMDDR